MPFLLKKWIKTILSTIIVIYVHVLFPQMFLSISEIFVLGLMHFESNLLQFRFVQRKSQIEQFQILFWWQVWKLRKQNSPVAILDPELKIMTRNRKWKIENEGYGNEEIFKQYAFLTSIYVSPRKKKKKESILRKR